MKHKHLLALLAIFALATAASAQTLTADTSAMLTPEAQNFILGWLLALTKSHPWIATVITILGSARLWAKPLFSLVHMIADLTPSNSDNTVLDKAVTWFHGPLGSKVAYLLDWTLSIKVIPPSAPAPVLRPSA